MALRWGRGDFTEGNEGNEGIRKGVFFALFSLFASVMNGFALGGVGILQKVTKETKGLGTVRSLLCFLCLLL